MIYYLRVIQKYATFSGRASRSEFWFFLLFDLIITFVLAFVGGMIQSMLIYDLYSLALIVPALAVNFRRMHDIGRSGWYCFIPIYNIILACKKGVEGTNEYGIDPLATIDIEST